MVRIIEHESNRNEVEFGSVPKVELHAHLNGSLSFETIEKLLELKQEQLPDEIIENTSFFLEEPKSMEDAFKIFPIVHSVTQTFEAIKLATIEVITDFCLENTVYLELRTTPKKNKHHSKTQYIDAVKEGVEACSHLPIVVRILLSIDRRQSIEEAEQTVELARKFSSLVVGIDLSGDPSCDGRKFMQLLKKARLFGLKLAIHLAEVDWQLEEVTDFLNLVPDRIGHGTFLHRRQEWVDLVEKHSIPLEICLTSNVLSSTTTSVADSHLKFWLQRGVPVSICTDDKGIMCTSLSNEMALAAQTFSLSRQKVAQITQDSLENSFLDKESEEYVRLSDIVCNYMQLTV